MSKHEKYTRLKRQIGLCLAMGVALFSAVPMAFAATSVVANNQLPTKGTSIMGNHTGLDSGSPNNPVMNIHQTGQNGVIKWESFNVGGSATVNFTADVNKFNTLNYVTGGNMSQIYGTINATGGNIYIVNPSGVQIGNSAQINVGSLYVSNAKLGDDLLKSIDQTTDINQFMKVYQALRTDAELMSLGNINATNITFEGNGRIVIDTERIKDAEGKEKLGYKNIQITTNDKNNIVVGYKAYDEEYKTYEDANSDGAGNEIATVNGNAFYKNDGYMWVEDVEQLQAINTKLKGNYALRNSIDATGTAQKRFTSIGNTEAFSGKFDGIKYNIFGLTITGTDNNAGLFAKTYGATINNVTLVGGSITGGSKVGAIVGNAVNTTLTNVVNSAAITGTDNVGGIVGSSTNSVIKDAVNTGTIEGTGENVGGLIGSMGGSQDKSQLIGNSYNLGNVSSTGANVGGLVGHAVNSIIGDGTNLVYNVLDVTGLYNVGGIVGNMEQGSKVQNAENSGNVTATGHIGGKYIYHTDATNIGAQNGIKEEQVYIANVGGIAGTSVGSSFKDVLNTGDISSNKQNNEEYYDAGNVGGIVGSAVDTNITNATNRENNVRGAHNVGGIAGYFANSIDNSTDKYKVNNGVNDGGDIMATGARNDKGYVTETIRQNNKEKFTIGNMGGIVGYMDGDNVYITASANRGTVHTYEPNDPTDVPHYAKAANAGGIVGKIDRDKKSDDDMDKIRDGEYTLAAVSNSYNTGEVMGYTGIGGIAGMMYNGEIAGAYNLGTIRTTRQSSTEKGTSDDPTIDPINMGGIVGDTTEQSSARVYLYDVYNKGKIGDETYTYFGRHVGGIVGRLSGTVEKAYNTGAIYNGYNVVGGIAGWMVAGNITDAFNTGNITVVNKNYFLSEVGGIVGSVDTSAGDVAITNVYNLGTIRSFAENVEAKDNVIGGILGGKQAYYGAAHTINIKNAYTTGNLYVDEGTVYSIYSEGGKGTVTKENTYYIKPANGLALVGENENSNKAINFEDKDNIRQYSYVDENDGNKIKSLFNSDTKEGIVNEDDAWRIYEGSTPILNAFLPNAKDYFDKVVESESGLSGAGIGSIQYGTAYDPLLTIIKANETGTQNGLKFNWQDLGINNDAGIAVYGAGLTLDDFKSTGGSGYFGGLIYSDGALNINANVTDANKDKVTGDVSLGSSSQLYGSSVSINADGNVVIYGTVTATGNSKNGVTEEDGKISVENPGDITINAGNVDVYGKLTAAAAGESFSIPGINSMAEGWNSGTVDDPYVAMSDIGNRFAYETGASKQNGDISITATGTEKDAEGNTIDGDVNLFFGNQEQGLITAGGSLKVEAQGDVFVDSDLDIGGNMKLASTGKEGEVLLTLTNIGKVQADRFTSIIENAINGIELNEDNKEKLESAILDAVQAAGTDNTFGEEEAGHVVEALLNSVVKDGKSKIEAVNQLNEDIAVEYMHDFMHSFDNTAPDNHIALNADSGDAKLTVNMWVENADGTGKFDFEKYDSKFPGSDGHTFVDELNALDLVVNDKPINKENLSHYVYVEVNNGEQLKGIQEHAKSGVENASDALGFNYALMGDLNASHVNDFEAIGTGNQEGFTGTFDGRGNRVIGLEVNGNNAGIFSTVGSGGVVKNVNIYSGTFTGDNTAGAVAGKNNGRIEGVKTFGNTVKANGNAGGIVGINDSGNFSVVDDKTGSTNGGELTGGIYDVESTSSVIAGHSSTNAGGLVGTNEGALGNSFSDSAVTVQTGVSLDTGVGLGGVVGMNKGNVQVVDSLGVTNGGDTGSSDIGGIIGINEGNMYSGYNESIVSGAETVGGIIGNNNGTYESDKWNGGTVENVVNATRVTGTENVGGLIGINNGSVTNGRNNGTITGTTNVGGLVGDNAHEESILTNLVNDSSAEILGVTYVGGIAGNNNGTITAKEQNLVNRGSITGNKYVGGVAGLNTGIIMNTNNDVELHASGTDAQYFGGVVGQNGTNGTDGTQENNGIIKNATNTNTILAPDAKYVGGIAGWNTAKGELVGMGNSNEGTVIGGSYVGGVIGKNDAAIGGKDKEQVGVTNEGMVIATKGGAGGLIGENNAAITNTIMTNRGEVHGNNANDGSGTGGIIGVNKGAITYSSLMNEINGVVTGTHNVGGLIGVNTGDITGGRETVDDTDAGMYINKIYNNGEIKVGTYTDNNQDGTYEFQESATGNNIGGLFGTNIGEVTAAYNTGAIVANGSENVGGIAGTNSGVLNQVFSTVFNKDGTNGSISGGTNTGGLVGTNAGTLKNAYNTSGVSGDSGSFGTLVGNNSGIVANAYTTVSNHFFGDNSKGGSNVYFADKGDIKWQDHNSYEGFDFDTDGSGIWKNYDGYGNPLLKVFLTKAYYDPVTGTVVAADGLEAHHNVVGGLIFPGGLNDLWSIQIDFDNDNPNWLGYDLQAVPFMSDDNWDFLYDDAPFGPFDRNRDFRERKAEINFVDGGMEL